MNDENNDAATHANRASWVSYDDSETHSPTEPAEGPRASKKIPNVNGENAIKDEKPKRFQWIRNMLSTPGSPVRVATAEEQDKLLSHREAQRKKCELINDRYPEDIKTTCVIEIYIGMRKTYNSIE